MPQRPPGPPRAAPLLLGVLAAASLACAAPLRRAPAPVAELWLTTADGARRLAQQPSPVIGPDDGATGTRIGGCVDCRFVVTVDSAAGVVTRNEEWWALAHASRFVLPGAYRVASDSDVDGVHTVAFRNPDGARVLVAVNEADAARTLVVREGARAMRAVLPSGSVATLRWR